MSLCCCVKCRSPSHNVKQVLLLVYENITKRIQHVSSEWCKTASLLGLCEMFPAAPHVSFCRVRDQGRMTPSRAGNYIWSYQLYVYQASCISHVWQENRMKSGPRGNGSLQSMRRTERFTFFFFSFLKKQSEGLSILISSVVAYKEPKVREVMKLSLISHLISSIEENQVIKTCCFLVHPLTWKTNSLCFWAPVQHHNLKGSYKNKRENL